MILAPLGKLSFVAGRGGSNLMRHLGKFATFALYSLFHSACQIGQR